MSANRHGAGVGLYSQKTNPGQGPDERRSVGIRPKDPHWATVVISRCQRPVGQCHAGEDIAQAFKQLAASQTGFDRWFKQHVQETTGADMNTPPSGPMSEILTTVEA